MRAEEDADFGPTKFERLTVPGGKNYRELLFTLPSPGFEKGTDGDVRRFHDLRHFFASMLIENGESPKYIQDQVGRASITTTFDTYGHRMPQAKQQATKKLQRCLFGKKERMLERC